MAKKVRTPPPPQRVQAPKVRTGRGAPKQARAPLREQVNPVVAGVAVAALVVVGVLVGVFATRSSPTKPPRIGVSIGNLATLPGAQLGKPPWNAGQKKLSERLTALGLTPQPNEQTQTHIHQHLDVYVNGRPVAVPQAIGFVVQGKKVTSLAFLHTHDPGGVIHVESPSPYDYTLGQFFGVWGVRLSKTCLGGLCGSQPLHVWVNGKPFLADPTRLVLASHQEIVVAFGTPPAKVPSHFSFPKGE